MDISSWRLPTVPVTPGRGQPNPQRAQVAWVQGIVWTDKSGVSPLATDGKLTGLQELVTLSNRS